MLTPGVLRHGREFLRAMQTKNFVHTERGIWFPKQGCHVDFLGAFESWVNGKDHDTSPNIVPTEARNYILTAAVLNGAAIGTWYIAPFKGNVTPIATLTGETFDATCTEATEYDEATRVAFVGAAAAAGSTSNSASKAVFTINAGITVYGAGALQSSAKEDATVGNKILCASKFSASRPLVDNDELSIQYTLNLTSA